MAGKARIAIACFALVFAIACENKPGGQSTSSPASGPAAAVQSNQYKAEGVVKAINQKAPAIEIDHGDIEGLMPAMQMEFPVSEANLLNGIAVNDRIEFTLEDAAGGRRG